MRLWTMLVLLVSLVGAACGGGNDQPTDSTTSTAAAATTATTATTAVETTRASPTTTTTTTIMVATTSTIPISTTTTIAGGPPPFFRYGYHGVTRVEGERETVLVDVPVVTAWSDGVGGLLFTYHWDSGVDRPLAIRHLAADATEPEVVAPDDQGAYSVINFDGRTAVVRYDDHADRRCEEGSLGVYDLDTGARESFADCSFHEDATGFPGSYGGGLFVGVRRDYLGSCWTDSGILFWNRSGAEVDVAANPFPFDGWEAPVADWIPCELGARLSPDGRLLAYRFRPDNKWPCPEYDDVPDEDWFEQSRSIPGVVVVLNLETGAKVFRSESAAEERLADFDGRFLVLTTVDQRHVPLDQLQRVEASVIVDITGNTPDHTVDGRVRLIWTHDQSAP